MRAAAAMAVKPRKGVMKSVDAEAFRYRLGRPSSTRFMIK